jgi:hypothetical protein
VGGGDEVGRESEAWRGSVQFWLRDTWSSWYRFRLRFASIVDLEFLIFSMPEI